MSVAKVAEDPRDQRIDLATMQMTGRDSIRLLHLPSPPSSNNQYSIVNQRGVPRHVPSKELVAYHRLMDQYPFRFPNAFAQAKKKMQLWQSQGMMLEFHAIFFFEKKRLFTQDHRVKKFDVSNRLKALHDRVSLLLGCDDSIFFRVFAEKTPCEAGSEMVSIEIIPYR